MAVWPCECSGDAPKFPLATDEYPATDIRRLTHEMSLTNHGTVGNQFFPWVTTVGGGAPKARQFRAGTRLG